MSVRRLVFRLVNPAEQDFTGFKGPYHFKNGLHSAVVDASRVDKRVRVMKTFYGARLEDGTSQVQAESPEAGSGSEVQPDSDVRPNGSGPAQEGASVSGESAGPTSGGEGSVPGGDGHGDPGDDGTDGDEARFYEAVTSLDPSNDEHWTSDGRPRIDAVEQASGKVGVKRADVDRVAPGYNRESASQANAT